MQGKQYISAFLYNAANQVTHNTLWRTYPTFTSDYSIDRVMMIKVGSQL